MKKFTLILSLLVAMVTTAMGQINYGKGLWTFPATSHDAVTEVPAEIFTDFATQYNGTELTNEKVGVFVTDVRVAAEDNVTATFVYNGGNIRMDISGVDLVNANGEVVYSDYHFGYSGGNKVDNVYTLTGVAVGDYTMRMFIPAQKEDITSASNDSKGKLTITGAWMYPNEGVYYNIKNVRSNKYVTFKGEGERFTQESANNGAGSYWYFVEASLDDVKKWENPWLVDDAIPAGVKPYWVYSAACEKGVENVTNGYMSAPDMSESYPAKIYYIGVHTKGGNTGLIFCPCHEDGSSWNDAGGNGTALGHYTYDDPGSLWSIELANITESDLIAMGTTAKNNALATVDSYQKAYYNNATAEQINTAKTALNNIDCSTKEKALTSVITGAAATEEAKITSCVVAPKAGDRFMIKGNVQQNDYLIAATTGNVKTTNGIGANDINALDLVWTLKAVEEVEDKFYLYNERLSVYVAPLTTTANGKMGYVTEETGAGVYSVELKGTNVAFHADGQDAYGYIHHPRWGSKELTRWEANDANSQWQLIEAPLELTTDIEAPICYAIKSGRDGNYYFTLENNKIKLINNQDIVGNNNAKWFFMLDENKNLMIYPYADKNNSMGYITVEDNNTKLTNDHNADGFVADTYTLYYNPNLAAKNNGKCFAFRPTEGNTFVSNHGGTGYYMGFYNEHDDKGTRLGFENINKEDLVSKIETWEQYIAHEGDKLGQYVISDEIKTAMNNAPNVVATKSSTDAAYKEKVTALDAFVYPTINMPETGKYYRLKNNKSEWYATSDLRTGESEHANKLYMKEDGSQANTIWYLATNNVFLSYTVGQYLGDMSSDWSFETIGSEGNSAVFAQGATIGKYQIQPSSNRALYGDKVRVDAAGVGSNSGNYEWIIEEVTTLPVTISTVGFATFYAPVAVEVPAGVTAYYLTSEGVNTNYITMTEIVGSVIPANTGVILEGAKGPYSFNITNDVAAIDNNLLTGTVAATYVTEEAYVLSAPNGDVTKLGLYTANRNKVDNTAFKNNSHKAYLPKSVLSAEAQNSNGFRFDFDGTTAIEDVEVEETEVKAIYDLQGRKVENPTKGIYIINGNKVLVK